MADMESSTGRMQIALSGMRGSGKTSCLIGLVAVLKKKGVDVKGVLSPAVFEGERKVAIEMEDLATGERRILARLVHETPADLEFGDWAFNEETIAWGNACLSKVGYADVLIIDEIGPLELTLGRGLQEGLRQMTLGKYRVGILTIRPKCLSALKANFPGIREYPLSSWKRETLMKEIIRIAINK